MRGSLSVLPMDFRSYPAAPFAPSWATKRGNEVIRTSDIFRTALLTLALTAAARAQTPDPADIADGMRIFQQKGNCQACHGWAGDGRKMDSQMPDGANLRESKLDRATLIMIVKCGVPGGGMPPFDKFAYSD